MTQLIEVNGIKARIEDDILGQGGQGAVYKGVLESHPDFPIVLKEMPFHEKILERTQYLCDQGLAELTPAFAAPISVEHKNGQIISLAPYVEGIDWENDKSRVFPQLLEMALEFVSLLVLLQEEVGITHGDIAPSNIRIADDGTIFLIDFDGYISQNPNIPEPMTIGQRPMQAPELRNQTGVTPNFGSDRFAMAVQLSMLLLGRYPTDGLGDDPITVDRYMSQGSWPEFDRSHNSGEFPIEALGEELQNLFDDAFDLNPDFRPDAKQWQAALTRALENCWMHDCGQAFVGDQNSSHCPGCGQAIQMPTDTQKLKIILANGEKYGVKLVDGQPLILGRSTLPNLATTVSGNHLKIIPHDDQILLHHMGSNPTLIQYQNQWYRLNQHWIKTNTLTTTPLKLKLADVEVTLKVE